MTSWIKRNNSCYQKVQAFCCVHDYFIKIVVSLRTRVVKEKERAHSNISFCWLYYIVSTIPCKKSWDTVLIKDDFSVSDIFVFFYPTILHKIVGSLPPHTHTLWLSKHYWTVFLVFAFLHRIVRQTNKQTNKTKKPTNSLITLTIPPTLPWCVMTATRSYVVHRWARSNLGSAEFNSTMYSISKPLKFWTRLQLWLQDMLFSLGKMDWATVHATCNIHLMHQCHVPLTRNGFMSKPISGNDTKWLIFDEKYISCLKRLRCMHKICKDI